MKKVPFIAAVLLIITAAAMIFWTCDRPVLSERAMEPVTSGAEDPENKYDSFNILTCIRKLGDTWFLVDCYHDQILYSSSPDTPPKDWKVMTRQIKHGHTISSDGELYLADDTENNRIMVFKKGADGFELAGEFNDMGILPHFTVYDEGSKRFYALSSMTGELFVFRNSSGTAVLERTMRLEELDGSYVRSFTIIGDEIYFVSGNMNILRARLSDLKLLERYPVNRDIAGMVQLERIGGFYYITISTDSDFDQSYATMIRVKDLTKLESGAYEDIYGYFEGGGTPYYIGSADGHFYLTEHRLPGRNLWQFDIKDDQIINVLALN